MAAFKFQLEGVLRQRKSAERERQRQVAAAQAQLRQLEGELRGLEQTVQEATGELRRTKLVGTLDLSYLAAHRRFVAAMQRKGMALVQRMALAQRQLEESRKALTEAAIQRKVMEKLRERQQQRWQAEQERREVQETDEIGMQLSVRSMFVDVAQVQEGGAS